MSRKKRRPKRRRPTDDQAPLGPPGFPSSPSEFAWDMAELIAGDESDGVFWGVFYQFLEDADTLMSGDMHATGRPPADSEDFELPF